MLPESFLKKKFLPLVFLLVFLFIKPSKGKEPIIFPWKSNQESLNKNDSSERFIFGISYFNVFRDKKNAFEGRFEYRSSFTFLSLKPFTGITFASSGAYYGMLGLYSDISLWNNVIFTPSFAAGYFNKGMGIDLAYELEFRTQLEISYILQNNSRIGFGFYHISNGNLGRSNPGAETITFIYSLPIN
jgi:hypothetical protein